MFRVSSKHKVIIGLSIAFLAISTVYSNCSRISQSSITAELNTEWGILGEPLEVQPVFLGKTKWLDYVGPTSNTVESNICDPSADAVCIHAGERRQVILPPILLSCTDLTFSDSLGAFDWKCEANPSGVTISSLGLRKDVGLADLIDSEKLQFRPNSISIFRGNSLLGKSLPSIWWQNSIEELPLNSNSNNLPVNLSNSGTIYTIKPNETQVRYSSGYIIDVNQMAIVIPKSMNLQWSGSSTPTFSYQISTSPVRGQSLFFFKNSNFHWLEGKMTGSTPVPAMMAQEAVTVSHVNYFTLRSFVISSFATNAITIADSSTNFNIHYGQIQNLGSYGVRTVQSKQGSIFDLQIVNPGYGIRLQASDNINSSNIQIYSSRNVSFDINGQNHVVSNLLLSEGKGSGISLAQVKNVLLHQVTLLNNGSTGVAFVAGSNEVSISNSIVEYTDGIGVLMDGLDGSVALTNNAIGNSNGNNLANISRWQSELHGFLLMSPSSQGDATTNCNLPFDSNPSFAPYKCTTTGLPNSNEYPPGSLSDAVLRLSSKPIYSGIVGKVTSDKNFPGTIQNPNFFPANANLLGLENIYRYWGSDRQDFRADGANRGCHVFISYSLSSISEPCNIWDLRLKTTNSNPDTENSNPGFNKSGDGLNLNEPFIENGPCPSAVHGNHIAIAKSFNLRPFLVSASEIFGDHIGNDDGLCESNETCIYSPHIGVYQGENEISDSSCKFQDGIIKGVTMKARKKMGI